MLLNLQWGAIRISLLVVMLGLFQASPCKSQEAKLSEENPDCLQQLHDSHPARYNRSWQAIQALPIDRRIMRAPNRLIDYLNLDNQLHGFPNKPRAAKIPRKFLKALKTAIAEMPGKVIDLVDDRLMGIFLVEDLGGSGMTDYVFDEQEDAVGAIVVLDVSVLTLPANQWATWKENTPFVPDPDFDLQAIIEADADNNLKQALQYILLHELGHVASVGAEIHPPWSDWNCRDDPPGRYPYFELSWELADENDCTVRSRFDTTVFSYRTDVIYYFGARLPESVSPDVYAQLEQTNFPSLYAATSPADDFAEAFVTYVHQELLNKSLEIRIDKAGKNLTEFNGCWDMPRCAVKRKILEDLFSPE